MILCVQGHIWKMNHCATGGLRPAAEDHSHLVPEQEAAGPAAGGQQGDHQGCSEPQRTG